MTASAGWLQRRCACGQHTIAGSECTTCSKEREQRLRRSATGLEPAEDHYQAAPPIVHEVLRSPGQPLDNASRAFFEPRFGYDFSRVRVHTDAKAAESAQSVNALAYTVRGEVVFGAGQYRPYSSAGRQLMAHELTHVVQQRGHEAELRQSIEVGSAHDSYEREADQTAALVLSASPNPTGHLTPSRGGVLQRACVGRGRWASEYDGCSVPPAVASMLGVRDKDNPAGGRDTQFALGRSSRTGGRACDRHDECYQTCLPIPGRREVCDSRMFIDMRNTCAASSESQAVKDSCSTWAAVYYSGLVVAGLPAFISRQSEVCSC